MCAHIVRVAPEAVRTGRFLATKNMYSKIYMTIDMMPRIMCRVQMVGFCGALCVFVECDDEGNVAAETQCCRRCCFVCVISIITHFDGLVIGQLVLAFGHLEHRTRRKSMRYFAYLLQFN